MSTTAPHPAPPHESTTEPAAIPLARHSQENAHTADWARLLRLAATGHLHALPSPVTNESVLIVYHLPEQQPGAQGDHGDAVFLRQLVHAGLTALATPAPRFVPNGDLHYLRHVIVTDAGHRWLATQHDLDETAALRPIDAGERTFTAPGGWGGASWSGAARMR